MAYRNETKGARAIHLLSGARILVEPGATADVDESKVKRLAPGLVKSKKGGLPKPPADLAAKVEQNDKPLSKMNKAELIARAGISEEEADNLTKADLIAKIEG